MPMPYQEEVWRISKFSEIFGKFLTCSEFFQEVKRDGEYKFRRDDFFLGHSILLPHELFLNNKNCEAKLITAEILNCLLGFFDIEYIYSHFDKAPDDDFFDDLETDQKRNLLNVLAGLDGLPCLFGIADVCPCNWQCLGGGSCCIA